MAQGRGCQHLPDAGDLVRVDLGPAAAPGDDAPADMALVVEVVHLEGEHRVAPVGAEDAVRRGADDDRVLEDGIVDRDDVRSVGGRQRHPSDDARPEEAVALLGIEVEGGGHRGAPHGGAGARSTQLFGTRWAILRGRWSRLSRQTAPGRIQTDNLVGHDPVSALTQQGPRRCGAGLEGAARSRGGVCAAAGPAARGAGQAVLIAEISNSRVTLSLTRTPPVSRAAFQVMPHSLRLMTTEPSKPTRWLPNGSTAVPS